MNAMARVDDLYAALKADLNAAATPLLELGEQSVRKRGAFLPFGAALCDDGEVKLVTAISERDLASAEDVLPLLLEALAHAAAVTTTVAVATAEWVLIATDDTSERPAIKVSVHHRGGLAIAFYEPATKGPLGGWQFGELIARPSAGLVSAWPAARAVP